MRDEGGKKDMNYFTIYVHILWTVFYIPTLKRLNIQYVIAQSLHFIVLQKPEERNGTLSRAKGLGKCCHPENKH